MNSNYRLRICDLPSTERPRERLLEAGPRNLSTGELIAILLGTGQGPGKLSAVGLAHLLLNELGRGSKDPLSALREVSPQQLMKIDGIGPAKGATILAAIELGRRTFLNRPLDRPIIDGPETAHLIFQSDIAIVQLRADYYETGHPQPQDVLLLVEVADTTLEFDRSIKTSLYANVGIPEVWIVDLSSLAIEIYREPSLDGYKSIQGFQRNQTISAQAFPGIDFDLVEIFG